MNAALKTNVLFNTMLFSGNANPALGQEIASNLGIELGKAKIGRFSDGEVDVELLQNVRARDIFVVQSTCHPTNENLMELLILVDALKRASARRITAVMPYFGYARQDRRSLPPQPEVNRRPLFQLKLSRMVPKSIRKSLIITLRRRQSSTTSTSRVGAIRTPSL